MVTILIPNYKTLKITKLCLRLLHKYTDLEKAKVVVIDNDSADESLEYLKTLKWIELIERKKVPTETPGLAHASALDLALKDVITPYVLSIHTDTLVKDSRWLDVLLTQIKKETDIAGVGSWKLEGRPSLMKRMWKSLEYKQRYCRYLITGNIPKANIVKSQQQSGYYQLLGQKDSMGLNGKDHYFLRSHCALYRMDLLKDFNLTFSDQMETAGKGMHRKLVKNGYKMVFLPAEYLSRYLVHLNHATMVLHPELGSQKKTITKGLKRIKKELRTLNAEQILRDDSLDN